MQIASRGVVPERFLIRRVRGDVLSSIDSRQQAPVCAPPGRINGHRTTRYIATDLAGPRKDVHGSEGERRRGHRRTLSMAQDNAAQMSRTSLPSCEISVLSSPTWR
jgi:hypothetical protein